MQYFVYILWSEKLQKYYVGQTANLEDRLARHNEGREKFTKEGSPWQLVHMLKCEDRSAAMQLEKKIKKRGAKRFLQALQAN